MDRIPFTKAADREAPGRGEYVRHSCDYDDYAILTCKCGEEISLSGHTINQVGDVKERVECPGCKFNNFAKLEGWGG